MKSPGLEAFAEQDHTLDAVVQLKIALAVMGSLPQWMSGDGQYFYIAAPDGKEEIPFDRFDDMTEEAFRQSWNSWRLYRVTHPDINGTMYMSMYTISAGHKLIATTHEFTDQVLYAETAEKSFEPIGASAGVQATLGWHMAELIDYATVDNALYDLQREVELHLMANPSMDEL